MEDLLIEQTCDICGAAYGKHWTDFLDTDMVLCDDCITIPEALEKVLVEVEG